MEITTLKHQHNEWDIQNTLGRGSYGTVVKGKRLSSDLLFKTHSIKINDLVAIKIIRKDYFSKNEIEILNQLNHQLIVKYYGYAEGEQDDNIYIYMELINGSTISSILKKQPTQCFPEEIIKKIVQDLVIILLYIHDDERRIIHRDLKCDNILLVHDDDHDHDCTGSCSGSSIGGSSNGIRTSSMNSSSNSNKSSSADHQSTEQQQFYQQQQQQQQHDQTCNCNNENEEFECKLHNSKFNTPRSIGESYESCESCGNSGVGDNEEFKTVCNSINCIYSISKKIKLIDFGLSKGFGDNSKYYSTVGTNTHMAPEVRLANNTACRKSDIWSLGCTIIEMAGGIKALYENDSLGKPKIPDSLSSICKNFIQRCLTVDPLHRSDILALATHNFINKTDGSEEDFLMKFEDRIKLVDSLSNCTSKIEFDDEFNDVILPNTIPISIKSITFGFDYDQILEPGSIPNACTSLEFTGLYNQDLVVGSLPNSLQHLTFGARFNKPLLQGVLPIGLTTLNFGWNFNEPLLPGVLPNTLKKLTFQEGGNFNQILEIGSIPSSVTHLIFGDYDQIIGPHVLPENLITLELSGEWNKPLQEFVIPESTTSLTFGYSFNQPLTVGVFKNNLKFLKFGSRFNQPLQPKVLPMSLTKLYLGYYFNQELVYGSIPNSVTELVFEHRKNLKKVSLDYLEITNCSKELDQNEIIPLTPESLPESITSLTIGKNQNHVVEFNCLPPDLLTFKYNGKHDRPLIPRDIPNSTTNLKLRNYGFDIKKASIPRSVTVLSLGSRYFKFPQILSLTNLHASLRDLKIHTNEDGFNIYNLKDIIPNTITYLEINGDSVELPIK